MLSGLCSNKSCRATLTQENCSPSVFRRGGKCRLCVNAYLREVYRRDPQKAVAYQLEWRKKHPKQYQAHWRKTDHGITKEEFDNKLCMQKGLCAICNKILEVPYIDHDHKTEENRGLLCRSCNLLIGFAYEQTEILASAIRYLQKYAVGISIQTESV